MSLGLIYRAVRETRVSTLSFAAGLFVFELLVGMMLATFHKEFSDKFLPLEFIQKMFAALLGAEVGTVGPAVLSMLGWVHPIDTSYSSQGLLNKKGNPKPGYQVYKES